MATDLDDLDVDRSVALPSFSSGTFFADRFKIQRDLGKGGMGHVYAADDVVTKRRVALKVLKKASLKEETGARFQREVEILRLAHHPCIVRIDDFGHAEDGTAWLSMELLEGETLRERVQRAGPIPPHELVPILLAACDGLTAA